MESCFNHNTTNRAYEAGQEDGKRLMKSAILALLGEMFETHDGLSAEGFSRGIKAAKERIEKFA